jgi:23S rRNA pseudouridine1911/1915/1917 synthase
MVKACQPGIIFEDDDVLVVDKPGNLVCHSASRPEHTSLADWIRENSAVPARMINRLDRETSGLVIVAKNERAVKNLGKQVLRREIRKEYIAICWGTFAEERGVIDKPIGVTLDSAVYTKRVIDPAGKPSVTEFETVAALYERRRRVMDENLGGPRPPLQARFTVVRLRPQTGRAHQLRVHLASIGHPIVGDKIYGPDEKLYLEFIRDGVTDAMLSRLLMARHALHAEFVEFKHPFSQQPVRCHAPLPEDMARFIEEHR